MTRTTIAAALLLTTGALGNEAPNVVPAPGPDGKFHCYADDPEHPITGKMVDRDWRIDEAAWKCVRRSHYSRGWTATMRRIRSL